jgi:hypothetical protein
MPQKSRGKQKGYAPFGLQNKEDWNTLRLENYKI